MTNDDEDSIFYCSFCDKPITDGEHVLAENGDACCSSKCADEVNFDSSH